MARRPSTYRWPGTAAHESPSPSRRIGCRLTGHSIEHAASLAAQGRRPYVMPRGGATPVGGLGFARAAAELQEQLDRGRGGSSERRRCDGVRRHARWVARGGGVVRRRLGRPRRIGQPAVGPRQLIGSSSSPSRAPDCSAAHEPRPGFGSPVRREGCGLRDRGAGRDRAGPAGVAQRWDPARRHLHREEPDGGRRAGSAAGRTRSSSGIPAAPYPRSLRSRARGPSHDQPALRPARASAGVAARRTAGPAPELVESGFAWENADAPYLHDGLNLADIAHVLDLDRRGMLPVRARDGLY